MKDINLKALGFKQGDRVTVYNAMYFETWPNGGCGIQINSDGTIKFVGTVHCQVLVDDIPGVGRKSIKIRNCYISREAAAERSAA